MYCTKCGNQMNDADKFCTNCGAVNPSAQQAATQSPSQPQSQQQSQTARPANASNDDNVIAIVGFIFSFFGGMIGLICSIIGYNNAKKGAPHKNLALAGIIISIVEFAIAFIVGIFMSDIILSLLFATSYCLYCLRMTSSMRCVCNVKFYAICACKISDKRRGSFCMLKRRASSKNRLSVIS